MWCFNTPLSTDTFNNQCGVQCVSFLYSLKGSLTFYGYSRNTSDDPHSVLDSSVTSPPVGTRISKTSFPILLLLFRLVDVVRLKPGQNRSFILFSLCLSVLSIYFPSLCWKCSEAEREDVGHTTVKWRPGPQRSVLCVCVCVWECICILFCL